jgi:TRAP-type C4-dicarboxylate transport system substrate-binding protein
MIRRMNRGPVLSIALLAFSAIGGAARGEPVTLRMAAIAPEGTAWAREVRALAREIETETRGEVRMKWYLGGIAGDEQSALERVRHGQLDGLAGASFCERLAPSLRALRVVGLFQNRSEILYVLSRLKTTLDEEFHRSGFENLADTVFGADVFFSRRPIRNMADLRSTRWWMWSNSPIYRATLPAMGVRMVVSDVSEVAKLYQGGQADGFISPPSVALGFQWSVLASYFMPLETAMLPGCVVLANAAMDPLHVDQQQVVRAAAAKFGLRFAQMSAALDDALMDGLFEKQGLKKVPVAPQLRAEFFQAARMVRDQLGEKLVPQALLGRVLALLADYRAERRNNIDH